MSKTTTLHVHHAFLYISLPSLHNNDNIQYHVLFIVCHTIFTIVTNFSSESKRTENTRRFDPTPWLEILAKEDLPPKLCRSEKGDWNSSASNEEVDERCNLGQNLDKMA